MSRTISLQVNGGAVAVEDAADRLLLDLLRDDLGLRGCKYGCGEARCGACTVLVDGRPLRSCVTRVETLDGSEIRTIEGLADEDGPLHPLQEAFLECEALQCGYCTCGMILGALALLERHPDPDEAEFSEAMDGHLCRCGCYGPIREAVALAAKRMRGEEAETATEDGND